MDSNLERKIRLCEDSEYESLYPWSLQELNKKGEKIGRDQIPWSWSLYFTASEISHNRSIDLGKSYDSEGEEDNEQVKESETISAVLYPGRCYDGKWLEDDTSYSMFGTERRVKEFDLKIYKLEEGDDNERCSLWGCVSYTADFDFRDETIDDAMVINVWLAPMRFNNLVEVIKAQRADIVRVYLGEVSGFYSEWSPSIKADRIKILVSSEDQKIIRPDNCEIVPPRLGEVGKFEFSIIQRNKINPKEDLRSINIDKLFEESGDYEEEDYDQESSEAQPDVSSLMLAKLDRNELVLTRLRTPLWLIFIVLLLLLFK